MAEQIFAELLDRLQKVVAAEALAEARSLSLGSSYDSLITENRALSATILDLRAELHQKEMEAAALRATIQNGFEAETNSAGRRHALYVAAQAYLDVMRCWSFGGKRPHPDRHNAADAALRKALRNAHGDCGQTPF